MTLGPECGRAPENHLWARIYKGRNLERLRDRSPGGKRSLAFREFALGIEFLERLRAR